MTTPTGISARDHAERVAVFRHGIIGALATRDSLSHGELAEALRRIAEECHRPPDAERTRTFSVPTLQRWLYAYKKGGLDALRPSPRSDRGRGRDIPPELRELLLDIRREFPSASVPLILQTLVADGRLQKGDVGEATLRRLFRQAGLAKLAMKKEPAGTRTRLRWQTTRPDALWHGDVCHGPTLLVGGDRRMPVRIHALLDDHARYVVALRVVSTEKEQDMLDLFVAALRTHGKPDALYLDNGATYRGDMLQLLCGRLGITLLHARPHDPEARGKMERFWLTMRRQVLDYCGGLTSLHDIQVRLLAWLDTHYHQAPHGGLMGKTPIGVYLPEAREIERIDEAALKKALIVTETRKVRRDTTVSIDGRTFELDRGWLAGRQIAVFWSALEDPIRPWAEYEGKRYELHLVDPERNASRKRPPRNDPPPKKPEQKPAFDPPKALLDRALGRRSFKDPDDDQ
jgi:transposase InsO family protein